MFGWGGGCGGGKGGGMGVLFSVIPGIPILVPLDTVPNSRLRDSMFSSLPLRISQNVY